MERLNRYGEEKLKARKDNEISESIISLSIKTYDNNAQIWSLSIVNILKIMEIERGDRKLEPW